jgi:hypothetical protein
MIYVLYRSKFKYKFYSIPTFTLILSVPIIFLKRTGCLLIDSIKIDNTYFQFSILMDNIQLIIMAIQVSLIVYNITFLERVFFGTFKWFKFLGNSNLDRRNTNLIFIFSFCLYLVFFLLLTNKNTSTLEWIANPRDGYQIGRSGAGLWYAFAIIFLGVNSVILFIYKTTSLKKIIIYSLIYSYLWYLFGGKAYIISFFTLVLLSATIHLTYKLVRRIFILASSLIFFILLLLFFNSGFEFGISESLDSIVSYFDHYYYSTLFYEDILNGKINYFFGEIYFTSFYKYIPRILFESKPFAYGSVLLNELYLPGMAELGITPEFAGQANYFADFGILGVLIFNLIDINYLIKTFFFVLVLKKANCHQELLKSKYFPIVVFSFAPAFSQFISFPFDFLLLLVVVLNFSFFYKKSNVGNI